MKKMELLEAETGRIMFVRLFEGEDLLEAVTQAVKKSRIRAGFFILIGTLRKATMGFFHEGRYQPIEISGPLEIVSCMGNISIKENKPFVHAHIAVSNRNGEVFGGHVLSGCTIAATGELVLFEATNVNLQRELDMKTGLYLWSVGK
jgi:hypothetical protein